MAAQLTDDSTILIVGSGVFGISSALWLARSGYKNVTVLDMQDTLTTGYDPNQGIDSASADINKIIRFSYGSAIAYQRLATEGAEIWREWNAQLAAEVARSPETLPESLRQWNGEPKLFYNCGMCRMSAADELSPFEITTLENMEKEGIRDQQFRSDDEMDLQRAREIGIEQRMDPLKRQERFGVHKAVYDTTAGYAVAYRSCAWAQHLAKEAGVKFILGPNAGKAISIVDQSDKSVVVTADGKSHEADLVIVAGGGWTPSLLPQVSKSLETTAGSVLTIQLPRDRQDLWDRFAPENFPVCTLGMYEGVGIYTFPRTPEGVMKVAYRAKKWTNFSDVEGLQMSIPKTAHVTVEKESNLPLEALDAIKNFIVTYMPELQGVDVTATKLCWYTDSVDDSFMVDRVPGRPCVIVCSGGSGHGFKFLPILGREVVKIIEQPEVPNVYRDLWKWRGPGATTAITDNNGLDDGEHGLRVLSRVKMATEADWKLEWTD